MKHQKLAPQVATDLVSDVYAHLHAELGKAHPYDTAASTTLNAIDSLLSSRPHPRCVQPIAESSRNMASHWLLNPGKGSRIHLTRAIFDSCVIAPAHDASKTERFAQTVCAIVEATHNLSLIVDDCIDEDLVRRNGPTIFQLGGASAVRAVSCLLIGLIFRLVWTLPHDKAVKDACVRVIVGHSQRLAASIHGELQWETGHEWHLGPQLFSDVTKLYAVKSVGVVEMGLDLLHCVTSLDPVVARWLMEYITAIGIFLQRVNDIENYSATNSVYPPP